MKLLRKITIYIVSIWYIIPWYIEILRKLCYYLICRYHITSSIVEQNIALKESYWQKFSWMLKLDYKIYQRNYPNFICDQRISYFKDKPCFSLLSFFLVKLRLCHPPSSFELCDVLLPNISFFSIILRRKFSLPWRNFCLH